MIHELIHLGQHRKTGWSPLFATSRMAEVSIEMQTYMKLLRLKYPWTLKEVMWFFEAWNKYRAGKF